MMRYIIYAAILVILCSQNCQAGSVFDCSKNVFRPFPVDIDEEVRFLLFTKNADQGTWFKKEDIPKIKSLGFDESKKTVVVIHGFCGDSTSEITQDVKNALLEFDDVNVIAVDWGYIAMNPLQYRKVVRRLPDVGQFVSEVMIDLINSFQTPIYLHLVGFSLGAHVAGIAGRTMTQFGHQPARITGLDPAGPGFLITKRKLRLTEDDAEFVDCIHTSVTLGRKTPTCHADFYPNDGLIQPGCHVHPACSHSRSYEYFASSVNPSHKFGAWKDRAFGQHEIVARMGYYADPSKRGRFTLITTAHEPFSMD